MSLLFYYSLPSPNSSIIYRKFTVTPAQSSEKSTFNASEKERLSVLFIPGNPTQPHPLQLKGYLEVGPPPLVRSPLETQIETVINRFDPPILFNRVHVTTLDYAPTSTY